MMRTMFGRVAGSAAAAASAASGAAVAANSPAHAHAGRPMRLFSNSGVEDWVVPQLKDDDVLFSPEEVEQTVDDICGIAAGRTKVCALSDSEADSTESIEKDGNAVIDQANIIPSGEGMGQLAKLTTLMLSRPGVQREILDAFKQEPELREMVEELSCRSGVNGFISFPQRHFLPDVDTRVEDVTNDGHGEHRNVFKALIADIGSSLEAAGEGITKAGQHIGNFLSRAGRWLRDRARNLRGQNRAAPDEEEEDLNDVDMVLGVAMCFASIAFAVLVAKRVGVIRIIHTATHARRN